MTPTLAQAPCGAHTSANRHPVAVGLVGVHAHDVCGAGRGHGSPLADAIGRVALAEWHQPGQRRLTIDNVVDRDALAAARRRVPRDGK